MILFHWTNKNIQDGTATGTFFTNELELAIKYDYRKNGNIIYAITLNNERVNDIFQSDIFNEHYISRCFIPLDKLN
jgi:hypothetical protein